jgi:diguanylate cyclase (GGDEF)-like protein
MGLQGKRMAISSASSQDGAPGSWLSRQVGAGLTPDVADRESGTQVVMRTIYLSRVLIYLVNGVAWPLLLGGIAFDDPVVWAIWIPVHLLWPHVAFAHVRFSRDPWQAERINMTIDMVIIAVLTNELQYVVWYCLATVGAATVAVVAFGGLPLLARGAAAMLIAGALWGTFRGFGYVALAPVSIELFGAVASATPFLVVMFAIHRFMLAFERARQSIKRKNQIVESLIGLGIVLQNSDDGDELLRRSLAQVGVLFPRHGFAVVVRDRERPHLIHHAAFLGVPDEHRVVLLDAVRKHDDTLPDQDEVRLGAVIGRLIPLSGHLTLLDGFLIVTGKADDTDTHSALQLFADQIGAALQRAQLTRRLQLAADTDPLTGLYNRAYLQRALAELSRRRENANMEFAIIAIDVNGLKAVNDRHGHEAGDQLLLAAATLLRRVVRASDVLVRMGGDEFLILCQMCDRARAAQVMARIQALSEAASPHPITVNGSALPVPLSLSIGAASSDETPVEQLLQTADDRMYAEKARYYDQAHS